MTEYTSQTSQTPPWTNPRVVAAAIGALLFCIFVLQNARSVRVSFLFWDFNMRLIILMMLCAVAGAGIWELGKYLKRRNEQA